MTGVNGSLLVPAGNTTPEDIIAQNKSSTLVYLYVIRHIHCIICKVSLKMNPYKSKILAIPSCNLILHLSAMYVNTCRVEQDHLCDGHPVMEPHKDTVVYRLPHKFR